MQTKHFLRSVQLVSWSSSLSLKLGYWAREKELEVAPPLPSELRESSGGMAAPHMRRWSKMVSMFKKKCFMQMFSAAQSMAIVTLEWIGKAERTSETATGLVMVYPCP